MNIVSWNSPLRNLRGLDSELERFFEDFLLDRDQAGRAPGSFPRMDVVERDDAFDVYADLPGIKRDELDISMTSNVLTIKGSRHSKTSDQHDGLTREENGSFERALTLPEGVDTEQAEAHLEDGVLSLHIPKNQAAAARRIEIAAPDKKNK